MFITTSMETGSSLSVGTLILLDHGQDDIRRLLGKHPMGEFGEGLIGFHQAMTGHTFQILDGLLDPGIIQPGLSVAKVQVPDGLAQPVLQEYLPEILALRELRDLDITLNPLPAHLLELLAERALDQIVLPFDLAHDGFFSSGGQITGIT